MNLPQIANKQVINAGQGGIADVLALLMSMASQKQKPYGILIAIGVNDTKRKRLEPDAASWEAKYDQAVQVAKQLSDN